MIPGIIDAHSHTAVEGGVNECTDSVTAEVRIADVIDHDDVNIYRQLAGGVTTVNVLHGSCNAIGGQNAVLKLRWGKPPEELVFKEAPRGIKFALGREPQALELPRPRPAPLPRHPHGRGGGDPRGLRAGARLQARVGGLRQEGQGGGRPGGKPAPPRRDLRLETLRDMLDGKVLVHAHCYRADEILMLIRVAEEFGFKIRTFQHVLEGYKVASEIARHGAGACTFSDWWAYKLEAYDAIPYNAAIMAAPRRRRLAQLRLRRAGAPALLGGGQGGEVRRRGRGRGPQDGHPQPGLRSSASTSGWARSRWARTPTSRSSARTPSRPTPGCEMTLVDGVVYFDRAKDLAARKPVRGHGGRRQ